MTDVLSRLPEAEESAERRGLSRRQLIKAGAWAAPVIVLATATPAAAASVDVGPAMIPGGYVVNPTPGNLAPDLVMGAASVLGSPHYRAGINYGSPTYHAHLRIAGIQNGVVNDVTLRYIVPATMDPLRNATSHPSSWVWTMPGGNVTNFHAVWLPNAGAPTTGNWELSFKSPQWTGGETYLQVMVVAP